MFMSLQKNAGQNHNTKKAGRPFESVAKFRCLGTTLKNQNNMVI
jgi:hypothetical protein